MRIDRAPNFFMIIAYGLYMVGPDELTVSLHECMSFEDFDLMEHNQYREKAWDLYTSIAYDKIDNDG